jgi:hypothetical protein
MEYYTYRPNTGPDKSMAFDDGFIDGIGCGVLQ